jgi:hypothetical protein
MILYEADSIGALHEIGKGYGSISRNTSGSAIGLVGNVGLANISIEESSRTCEVMKNARFASSVVSKGELMASSKVIESGKNSSKVASGNANDLRRAGEAGKKALIWATGCILETASGGGVASRVGVQQLMSGRVSVYRSKGSMWMWFKELTCNRAWLGDIRNFRNIFPSFVAFDLFCIHGIPSY